MVFIKRGTVAIAEIATTVTNILNVQLAFDGIMHLHGHI